jgi:hypothetical protein
VIFSEVRIHETGQEVSLFLVTNATERACHAALRDAGLDALVVAVVPAPDLLRLRGGGGYTVRLRRGVGRDEVRPLVERLTQPSPDEQDSSVLTGRQPETPSGQRVPQ